jgi:hypothetical protein
MIKASKAVLKPLRVEHIVDVGEHVANIHIPLLHVFAPG